MTMIIQRQRRRRTPTTTSTGNLLLLSLTAVFLLGCRAVVHASSSSTPSFLDLSYLHRTPTNELARAIQDSLLVSSEEGSNNNNNNNVDIDLTSSLIGKNLSEILSAFVMTLPPSSQVQSEPSSNSSKVQINDDVSTNNTNRTSSSLSTYHHQVPNNTLTRLIARRNQWTAKDATTIFNFLLQQDDADDDDVDDDDEEKDDADQIVHDEKNAPATNETAAVVPDSKDVTSETIATIHQSSKLGTSSTPSPSQRRRRRRRNRRPAFVTLDIGWNNFQSVRPIEDVLSSTSSRRPGRSNGNHGKAMNQALQQLLSNGERCPLTMKLDVCALDPSTCRAIAKGIVARYSKKSKDGEKDEDDDGTGTTIGYDDYDEMPPPLSLHLARNEAIGDPGVAALAAAIRTVASNVRKQRRRRLKKEMDGTSSQQPSDTSSQDDGNDVDETHDCDAFVVLDSLDLSGCGIGDVGVKALAIALEGHPLCVRHLDLSNNLISDEGASFLARSLTGNGGGNNKVLETLDLSHNPKVGDKGGKELALAFQEGAVQNLILRSCQLHADGAACFGRALRILAARSSPSRQQQEQQGSSSSALSGHHHVRIDLSGNPLGILRRKAKSESKYSATALKSKATATTAAYMNLIGKTVQKGLRDFGLTDGSNDDGLDTLESDDEEESRSGGKKDSDVDDNESKTTCGALAFAEAFIGEDDNDDDADEEDVSTQPSEANLYVHIGLRHCSFDTRAAEALAAVLQTSRKVHTGMNLTLDMVMNHVLEEDMVAALHGTVGYEEQLTEMADNYLEALGVLRESRERAAAAARAAAARMRAEAEMEQSWGSPVAMRSRDYDDTWEDNSGEDEWDSDADYDLPEDMDESW